MNSSQQNINRPPYIRTSRAYPLQNEHLTPVLNKAHIEYSQAINARTIGKFETISSITGEQWSQDTNPVTFRQTLRKTFYFSAINSGATLSIPHEIDNLDQLTRFYGSIDTATEKRPLPYVGTANANTQTGIVADKTNINITNGTNAPNIVRGIIIIEYLPL